MHTSTRVRMYCILTVEGCFGEEGQESDSGELCLAFTDSYKKQRKSCYRGVGEKMR